MYFSFRKAKLTWGALCPERTTVQEALRGLPAAKPDSLDIFS